MSADEYDVVHISDLHPFIEVISNVGQPLFEFVVTRYGEPVCIVGDRLVAELLAAYFNRISA